jgi:hypothetical protein
MRLFPMLAAAVIAVSAAAVGDAENWFGDNIVLALLGCLAAAFVASNWWELWSTRD